MVRTNKEKNVNKFKREICEVSNMVFTENVEI